MRAVLRQHLGDEPGDAVLPGRRRRGAPAAPSRCPGPGGRPRPRTRPRRRGDSGPSRSYRPTAMIRPPLTDDERLAVVVVDVDEALQVAFRDARVRREVAQVAGALGEPGVQRHDGRSRPPAGSAAGGRSLPSESRTSALLSRPSRSVPRVVRVEAVQREDRLPGGHDRPVDRVGRRCPAPTARTARLGAVGHRGRARRAPGRRSAASSRQAGGVGVAGSSGSPVAIASRWVQARGHDLDQRVPAAAGGHPAAVAELVGEVAQREVARPAARRPTSRRSASGSSRWASAPHWVNSSCGPERAQHRRHHGVERAQPAGVVGAGRQRHVDRACPRRPRRRSRPGIRCPGTAPAASRAG